MIFDRVVFPAAVSISIWDFMMNEQLATGQPKYLYYIYCQRKSDETNVC